jgi:hypothetical protein
MDESGTVTTSIDSPSQVIVASEVGTWESERNAARATIDSRFTIANARDKLKKLYPVREEH